MKTPHASELETFTTQGREHLEASRRLLGRDAPPDMDAVRDVASATRALRGTAALLGLDSFQSFLGKLLAFLDDVRSSEVPWSTRLETVLGEAQRAEAEFLDSIARIDSVPNDGMLRAAEERLSAWRREAARLYETTADEAAERDATPSHGELQNKLLALVDAARQLQKIAASGNGLQALHTGLKSLAQELTTLGGVLEAAAREVPTTTQRFDEGFRNHCEGALRPLVESAAREVLDAARENDVRLALRATGAVEDIDDELGGSLLEILRNLWSDSLWMQAPKGAARIDCVLRVDGDRLIAEVHDPGARLRGTQEHDVFSRYTGLRRSRPIVEALQGLVWVEPEASPGCRFRVAVPRTTEQTAVYVVRCGAHELALPASAIDATYARRDVTLMQDEAGAVVEADGVRHPVLHLAFALGDVTWDELTREQVVIVGSFERRAALFASGPGWRANGRRDAGPDGPWLGRVETPRGALPLLDVGALVGRRRNRETMRTPERSAQVGVQRASVLVVSSSDVERVTLTGVLDEASYRTHSVQSAEEALDVVQKDDVDLLLCDLRLPEMNAQRIAELRGRSSRLADVPMVLMLTHAGEQSHLVVQQLNASGFVRTPIQKEELMDVVQQVLGGSKS